MSGAVTALSIVLIDCEFVLLAFSYFCGSSAMVLGVTVYCSVLVPDLVVMWYETGFVAWCFG